jgi:ubiquinone/menaquinone biosynthesis C-methylase UbiE
VSDLQHPDSRSFELIADVYERARPEYPPDAVAWIAKELDLRPGRTVLDLGAGTGKLTRALVATGADVIAVEPGEAMLAQLMRAVPEAQAIHGAAESIPLEAASVDAITAGQSFHWFRHDEAIPEMHRVLPPGAGVALIWNTRDQGARLQRELSELIEPLFAANRPGSESWALPLVASNLFHEPAERRFRFSQTLDADQLAERIASISFVAAAPVERQKALDRRVREIVAGQGGRVDFPYETVAYVSRKVE